MFSSLLSQMVQLSSSVTVFNKMPLFVIKKSSYLEIKEILTPPKDNKQHYILNTLSPAQQNVKNNVITINQQFKASSYPEIRDFHLSPDISYS